MMIKKMGTLTKIDNQLLNIYQILIYHHYSPLRVIAINMGYVIIDVNG